VLTGELLVVLDFVARGFESATEPVEFRIDGIDAHEPLRDSKDVRPEHERRTDRNSRRYGNAPFNKHGWQLE
jgi:hypothetical protein